MGILVQTFKIGRRQLIGTTTTAAFNCDVFLKRNIVRQSTNLAKLTEVGRLESPKLDSRYETGQLFLHRIFGYRGVILFPWTARVYDRDLQNPSKKVPVQSKIFKVDATIAAEKTHATQHGSGIGKAKTSDGSSKQESTVGTPATGTAAVPQTEPSPLTAGKAAVPPPPPPSATSENATKEIKGKVHTYYQVLIDSRDCPYIRAQTEAVTFLGNQDSNRSLYAIPGLDYVAHDDIMPYSSAEKHPLHHELFDKFLTHAPGKDPPFKGQETLKAWQEKNHPWLELSDVHKETTEGIRVTVIPFYMGCRETPASSVYWWRYCIRLENLGELSVQLRERHWRIFSLSGTLETVRGRGVVGQEPILSPRLPAFQYSSHVSLQAPSGHMWGTFRLEREDGHTFDCKIPPFSLESKPEDATPSSTTDTSGGSSATGNKRDDNE